MLRVLRHSLSYLLCLAAGWVMSSSMRPKQELMPVQRLVSAPSSQQKPPLETQALEVPKEIVSPFGEVPVLVSPEAKPLPVAASPQELKDRVCKQHLAGHDEAALAVFLAHPSLAERQGIAMALATNGRDMDPHFVARLVLSLPPGEETDKALGRLLTEWSSWDAEEALNFMATLPPERFNAWSLGSAGFHLSQLAPEKVSAFAMRLDASARGRLLEYLAGSVGQTGSWQNLSKIMELVPATTTGDSIPDFFLGMNLARIEPRQVERWIAEETDTRRRDQLISGYTRHLERNDPVTALRWDGKIVAEKEREAEFDRHLRDWLETDRMAALAWLRGEEARSILPSTNRSFWLRRYGLEGAP